DILFPPAEQRIITQHLQHAELKTIPSNYGHDGFLIEYAAIDKAIRKFLYKA
ncbi:MAG: homoserine O-acetyltransferase, partial [Bacteroidetes bacterium]